jgi:hypothetical protein
MKLSRLPRLAQFTDRNWTQFTADKWRQRRRRQRALARARVCLAGQRKAHGGAALVFAFAAVSKQQAAEENDPCKPLGVEASLGEKSREASRCGTAL